MPILPITANRVAHYLYGHGITSASDLVSRWDDASGSGNPLLQATGTNQPLRMPDNSILFDGVDNFLKTAAFTLNQPVTIYILFRQVTWTSTDTVFDGDASNTGVLYQTGVTPNLEIFAGASPSPITDLALNTYGIVVSVFNGVSSVVQLNQNTPITGNVGASNMGGFTLGVRGDTTTGPSNIQVKEVILYSAAHDAPTRRQIVNYLLEVNKTPYTDWYVANGSGVNAGRFRRR